MQTENKKQTKQKFIIETCDHCHQTLNYPQPLAKAHALTVLAIYNRVRNKGINVVDVDAEMVITRKEIKERGWKLSDIVSHGFITEQMRRNLTQIRYHGLVAFADGKGGNKYLVTRKAAKFLAGWPVPRTAIISTVTSSNAGYFIPDGEITFNDLMKKDTPFWSIPSYPEMINHGTLFENIYE